MITLSPAAKKLLLDAENFVRKVGSWVVVLNNLTHTFHISTAGTLNVNAILTAIAGSLIYTDHKAAKTPPVA